MTYKLLRHKDFTAEWEKLPVAIRDQFKKKLAKVIEQPHIPKNMLRGDLAGCYKIKGSRLADLHLILPNEVPQLSC